VLVHSNGDDERIIEKEMIFLTLSDLKREGKIRAFGMSNKTVRGGFLTVDHADLAMVAYSINDCDQAEVINYAYQHQKGIFIKKAFASGHLSKLDPVDPILSAMQFIFKEKGITSVVVGTINLSHLQENVKKACDCVLGD
jgi:aryl-alcohol dehydrogenase-like predicted oxidoreductase